VARGVHVRSEGQGYLFEPRFNRAVKVKRADDRVTSNGGALLLREVDHALSLLADLAGRLRDPRRQEAIRYSLVELLRARVFALSLGYRAQDDMDLLAHDPAMKAAVWDRPGDRVAGERLSSQPTQSRLLGILAGVPGNLEVLRDFLPEGVLRHQRASGSDRAVMHGTVDVDGFPVAVCGDQEGGGYNGYHQKTEYYPLLASFSPEGDYGHSRLGQGVVHAILRKGRAASDEGALRFIRKAVKKARRLARRLDVRMDAAFTSGKVMDPLTEDGILFIGRLKSNAVLDEKAVPHLKRPVGRPPGEGYEKVVDLGWHQAASWRHAQRLILVVVDKPEKNGQLKLEPDYFFLVTNREEDAEWLLEHYRARGTFEDRLGEFNAAIGVHLSSGGFEENEAMLLLGLLAFNLVGVLRCEMEDPGANGWDLKRLQTSVLKAGARMARGSQRLTFYLAAAVAPLWDSLVWRISQWRWPARWGRPARPKPRPWVAPPAHAHLCAVLRV